MDHFIEYWFFKYDNESFEKDFQKVSYMDAVQMMNLNQEISNHNIMISKDPTLQTLQKCLIKIHSAISRFFDNVNIDESLTDAFSRWSRTVQAFLECENLYALIFWQLHFIPNFVQCRIFASFIRYYKFLISFCQNIVRPEGISTQHNQRGEGTRQMNIIIKRLGQQQHNKGLYADWNSVLFLQKEIIDCLRPVLSPTPTLIGKLYNFTFHMFDKSLTDIKKEGDQLYGSVETHWVTKIISENQQVIKHIDSYIEAQESLNAEAEDLELFDKSETLKELVAQTEESYLPSRQKNMKASNKKDIIKYSTKPQILEKRENQATKNEVQISGSILALESTLINNKQRKTKNSFMNELKKDSDEQFNSNNIKESSTYMNSSNNPHNLMNSNMSFLANDVIGAFQKEQMKKSKLEEEKQRRFDKSKKINEQDNTNMMNSNRQIQSLEKQQQSPPLSQYKGDDQAPRHKHIEFNLDTMLSNNILNFITNAETSHFDIKDEDIVVDELGRKRKYRIKKRKANQIEPSLNSQSEYDSPERKFTAHQQQSSNSEVYEDENKRNLTKVAKQEQQKSNLSKLKQIQVVEYTDQDIRDNELFQYSYENSPDEDDIDDDQLEQEKERRLKLYKDKVPMPNNTAQPQDGIIFDILRKQMGEMETVQIRKNNKLLEIFNIDSSSLAISSKTGYPAEDGNKWYIIRQFFAKEQCQKYAPQIFQLDFQEIINPKKIIFNQQLRVKQITSNRQLF